MDHALLIFCAGLAAGAMNSVAGGGSFVSLPALVFAGIPALNANASSTVALFPGSLSSAIAYRNDFTRFENISLPLMLAVSVGGGITGALLLLFTPHATFDHLVAWLLLAGTLAFAFGGQVGVVLRKFVRIGPRSLVFCQFLLCIYGGYFGGAVGIMMLALWSLLGLTDLTAMNAAKALYVGTTNAVASLCFVLAGLVAWTPALIMLVAAVLGGYGGARFVRRIDPRRLRIGINAINFVMTALFFYRAGH
jgi:uncharacterized membrane protein YfcA